MNKYRIIYVFFFLICILLFSQGCTEKRGKDFFSFVKEIYPQTSQYVENNENFLVIKNVSLEEFNALTGKFKNNNFEQWHNLDNSAGFIIGVDEKIVFRGANKKEIIYSKSKVMYGKYIPVILFDVSKETLFCVLSTDLGG